MSFALSFSETVWTTLVGALSGGLIASGIVAYLTQSWIERRERRNRRDDLRLELYSDVVDLILDYEVAIANAGQDANVPPVELQTKRIGIRHRLILLGSTSVHDSYDTYTKLVFEETRYQAPTRPDDPADVERARNVLLKLMANEVQCVEA